MDLFARIAEDKIKEAIKKGELDNLPGMGKPLDLKDDLPGMSPELKMGYRMLKNAGFTPEDVKGEILSLEKMIELATSDSERITLERRLSKKQKQLDELLEKRRLRSNSKFGTYAEKIYKKLL